MNVSLTPELERFIAEQVEAGRYHSASEGTRCSALARRPGSRAGSEAGGAAKAVELGFTEFDDGGGLQADDVFKDLLDRLNRSEAA